MTASENTDLDLLEGVAAIADALGMSKRRAGYLIENGALPTFKAYKGSRIVCSRRSSLLKWLADREAAGRAGSSNG
jgi:hypothetical protein